MAQFFHLSGSGAFAKHLLDRIAGNEVDEQKNHGQDHRQGKQEAMQKMAGRSSADQRSFSRDFGFEVVRTGFDDSLAASLSVGPER